MPSPPPLHTLLVTWKTAWEREDSALASVACWERLRFPRASICNSSSALLGLCRDSPGTITCCPASWSASDLPLPKRSRTISLYTCGREGTGKDVWLPVCLPSQHSFLFSYISKRWLKIWTKQINLNLKIGKGSSEDTINFNLKVSWHYPIERVGQRKKKGCCRV